jgi:hypothetical protein
MDELTSFRSKRRWEGGKVGRHPKVRKLGREEVRKERKLGREEARKLRRGPNYAHHIQICSN